MKSKLTSILLGVLTCLMLFASGMEAVRAAMLVNNSASLNYTDYGRHYYAPVQDTAAVFVTKPPEITLTKDVANLRTGETSPDIVVAMKGDTIEFTLKFTNIGETDAFNVVMFDSIPLGTVYIPGSATDTNNLDPVDPPDTITFQHIAGGEFDTEDTGTVTAIRWHWDRIGGTLSGSNTRITKFRVRIKW